MAGYLNAIALELGLEPGEIKARSTAAAMWHVAKVALLREELARSRAESHPLPRSEPAPLNEVLAAALLSGPELEAYHKERQRRASGDDASR